MSAPPPDPRVQSAGTYLLPPTPVRGGNAPEMSEKTNRHIIVAFGLQVRGVVCVEARSVSLVLGEDRDLYESEERIRTI